MASFDHASWRRMATADARAAQRDTDRTIAAAATLTGLLAICGGDIRVVIGDMVLAVERLGDAAYRQMALDRGRAFTAPTRPEAAATVDPDAAGLAHVGSRDPASDGADAPAVRPPEEAARAIVPGQPYESAMIARPGGDLSLLDLLHTPELDAFLVAIAEAEGWLHADTVVERICGAFDQTCMTGETRKEIVIDLRRLVDSGRLAFEADFYAIPGCTGRPRDRSGCSSALQSARRVPPSEIRAAIRECLTVGPASRKAVASAVATSLGLQLPSRRLSTTLLGKAITKALRDLDEQGLIHAIDDSMLALAPLEPRRDEDRPLDREPQVSPPAKAPESEFPGAADE